MPIRLDEVPAAPARRVATPTPLPSLFLENLVSGLSLGLVEPEDVREPIRGLASQVGRVAGTLQPDEEFEFTPRKGVGAVASEMLGFGASFLPAGGPRAIVEAGTRAAPRVLSKIPVVGQRLTKLLEAAPSTLSFGKRVGRRALQGAAGGAALGVVEAPIRAAHEGPAALVTHPIGTAATFAGAEAAGAAVGLAGLKAAAKAKGVKPEALARAVRTGGLLKEQPRVAAEAAVEPAPTLGHEPVEVVGKGTPGVEPTPRKRGFPRAGRTSLGLEDLGTVRQMRSEVASGEAGIRKPTEEGVLGIPSSFPDYFKNKGYTKKGTLKILDKVLADKPLTAPERLVFDDLFEGKKALLQAEFESGRPPATQATAASSEAALEEGALPAGAMEFDPAKFEGPSFLKGDRVITESGPGTIQAPGRNASLVKLDSGGLKGVAHQDLKLDDRLIVATPEGTPGPAPALDSYPDVKIDDVLARPSPVDTTIAQQVEHVKRENLANRAAERPITPSLLGALQRAPKAQPGVPLQAPSPVLEDVLTAGLRPAGLKAEVRAAVDRFVAGVEQFFVYEPRLKGFPLFRNRVRLARGMGIDSLTKADQAIFGVAGDLRGTDKDLFRRLVVLADLTETGGQGLKLPRDLPTSSFDAEFNRLMSAAPTQVRNAVQRHFDLMKVLGQDLVDRGHLDPTDMRGRYYPHRVLDYTQRLDQYTPWIPKRLRTPFRLYTKRRIGTTKDINTDYEQVMRGHLTKVFLDNNIEDFLAKTATDFDQWGKMSRADRKLFTQRYGHTRPRPSATYELGGVRYRGFQFDPGNYVYKGLSVREDMLADAVANGLSASELTRMVGPRGGKAIRRTLMMGAKKRVYLLPEPIADTIGNFRRTSSYQAGVRFLSDATRIWKRSVLDFAGVPFQMNNLFGDLTALYREDVGAFRNLLAAGRLVTTPKASLSPRDALVLEKAQAQRIGGTTFTQEMQGGLGASSDFSLLDPRRWIEAIGQRREMIPRLAKFLTDVERIEVGKAPVTKTIDVTGLPPIDAAGKIAREFAVDYGALGEGLRGPLGRELLFPFVSFYAKNAPMWVRYVTKHPTEAAVKFGIPFAAMTYWNNFVHGETEAKLPEWYRYLPHIITGRETPNGQPIIVALDSPIALAARMVGLDRLPDLARRVARQEMAPEQAAWRLLTGSGQSVTRQLYLLLNPMVQELIAQANNKDSFTRTAIVPDRLRGTPQETALRTRHALATMVSPYAQYLKVSRLTEPDDPLSAVLLRGPLDIKRAFGIREVSTQAEERRRLDQAVDEQTAIRNAKLERMEEAFIKWKSGGQEQSDFLIEKRRILAEGGPRPSGNDMAGRFGSLRVKVNIVKERLRRTRDEGVRAELDAKLRRLERAWMAERRKQTPVAVRGAVRRALE